MVEENTAFRTETPAPYERTTRALLLSGAITGPLYIIVALIQAFTRPGFDLTRHSVSLLSLGDSGWIQITNFLLSGLLVIAGAVGLRRSIDAGPGSVWDPHLIALYGLSLIRGFQKRHPISQNQFKYKTRRI